MKKLLISALALFVVGSVAAQEGLGETYNKAVAAYNSKDFASAATAFETLIDQGLDSEDLDVQSWVATAKKSVPVCYFQMGLTAAKGNDFNTAVENLTKSANKAALYGELQQERYVEYVDGEDISDVGGKPFGEKNYAEAAAQRLCRSEKYGDGQLSGHLHIAAWRLPERFGYFSTKSLLRTIPNMRRMSKVKENIKLYTNNRTGCRARMISTVLSPLPTIRICRMRWPRRFVCRHSSTRRITLAWIASAEEAAAVKTDEEERSDVYFILGANFYNARTMPQQAIDAFRK